MRRHVLALAATLTLVAGPALASGEPSLLQVANGNGYLIGAETGLEALPGASGGRYEITFLAEITAMAQTSALGVYAAGDPGTAGVLFAGPVGPGPSTIVEAPAAGLGFFINPGWYPGKTWWSQAAWNTDGFDHIVVYETQNDGQYIIGFEDLVNGGDQDFQDQILVATFLCDDADDDGACDTDDNCPNSANADQADGDGDGDGDVCDACPADATNDADGDGVCEDADNCAGAANADQADADGDGAGDVCDACPADATNDADGDGTCEDTDNCPGIANADQADMDDDRAGDACDVCPADALDDADGDGVCGDVDNCDVANADQADADGDGAGDVCDPCPQHAEDDPDGNGVCGLQTPWAYGMEISLAEAYNRLYSTGYSTWDSTGLSALLGDHQGPMTATFTTAEVGSFQVLVFDSSATHKLSLSAGGLLIPVFDPGAWTPPSRGWQPDAGTPVVDVAALLEANGLDSATPFSFVLGAGITLNASNTYLVGGLLEGEWLIGYNDGGIGAGDADYNEPIIHLIAPPPEPTLACPDGYNIIEGTDGDDVLTGTNGNDCIYGFGGNDSIRGRGGDDVILGGPGNDIIGAGAGNDSVSGGSGDDTISGGVGNDLIFGDDGDDTLLGNQGEDIIDGGDGEDLIKGGSDADILFGGNGDDELRGHAGADLLYGGCGDDFVRGGRDDDELYGDGANGLDGELGDCGPGNDHIRGWRGSDLIYGGGGADLLRGGKDSDVLEGGDGEDTIFGGQGDDHLDGGADFDTLNGGAQLDVCVNGEKLRNCDAGGSDDDPAASGQATTVVWWQQGPRKNGTPVLAARSNPLEGLDFDAPNIDSGFFSLGFGGSIIVGFDGPLVNGDGADVRIIEKTYCCSAYPEELADVYAWDGSSAEWVYIGTAQSSPGVASDSISELDLGALPSTWMLLIVDITDRAPFGADGDGFDLNGVFAL